MNKFKDFINEKIKQYTLIYRINKNDKKVKLFGKKFVEKNKENYCLIINSEMVNLCEFYNIKDENKTNNLKVILIEKKKFLI